MPTSRYRSRAIRPRGAVSLVAQRDNALRTRSEAVTAARSNPLRADHAVERVTETVDLGPARDDEPCRVARVDQLEIDALKAMAEILHFATSRAGDLSVDDGKTSVDAHGLQTSLVAATSGSCVAGPGLVIATTVPQNRPPCIRANHASVSRTPTANWRHIEAWSTHLIASAVAR